ncbi:MAG: hypothetical protein ACREDR_01365, partial [Blastocatellia bacterium]
PPSRVLEYPIEGYFANDYVGTCNRVFGSRILSERRNMAATACTSDFGLEITPVAPGLPDSGRESGPHMSGVLRVTNSFWTKPDPNWIRKK